MRTGLALGTEQGMLEIVMLENSDGLLVDCLSQSEFSSCNHESRIKMAHCKRVFRYERNLSSLMHAWSLSNNIVIFNMLFAIRWRYIFKLALGFFAV